MGRILLRLAGMQTTCNPSVKKSSYIIMIFTRPKIDHAQSWQAKLLTKTLQYNYDCWMQKIKNTDFRCSMKRRKSVFLCVGDGLCAYIVLERSENAEISTLEWSSLCTKPLQKTEFIGSSRQKFQKQRL